MQREAGGELGGSREQEEQVGEPDQPSPAGLPTDLPTEHHRAWVGGKPCRW